MLTRRDALRTAAVAVAVPALFAAARAAAATTSRPGSPCRSCPTTTTRWSRASTPRR